MNTVRVSNSMYPDRARCFVVVVPDLGLNCLQRLSADDTSRQIGKIFLLTHLAVHHTHDNCRLLTYLLIDFGSLYCKQYGPRSDCSLGAV